MNDAEKETIREHSGQWAVDEIERLQSANAELQRHYCIEQAAMQKLGTIHKALKVKLAAPQREAELLTRIKSLTEDRKVFEDFWKQEQQERTKLSASLDERDRAIVEKFVLFLKHRTGYIVGSDFVREFGLDPKPEGA